MSTTATCTLSASDALASAPLLPSPEELNEALADMAVEAALDDLTIDICCAGHTEYVSRMSRCGCGEQYCPKHSCNCAIIA